VKKGPEEVMSCAAQVDALEARLGGAVAGPEQEALDAHLQGCADCRAYLEVAARAEQQLALREAAPLTIPSPAAPLAVQVQASPLDSVAPPVRGLVQRQLDRLRMQELFCAGLGLVVLAEGMAWGGPAWLPAGLCLGIAGLSHWQRRRWEAAPDPVAHYRVVLGKRRRELQVRGSLVKGLLGIFGVGLVAVAVKVSVGVALLGAGALAAWGALGRWSLRREGKALDLEVLALATAEENRPGP
jgi:predicted anti-sigma-YlaC factor YlaD